MRSVVECTHPTIRMRNAKTGEVAEFQISTEGTLEHSGVRFDQDDARRVAITYLLAVRREAA
jgi:hypothetical protein